MSTRTVSNLSRNFCRTREHLVLHEADGVVEHQVVLLRLGLAVLGAGAHAGGRDLVALPVILLLPRRRLLLLPVRLPAPIAQHGIRPPPRQWRCSVPGWRAAQMSCIRPLGIRTCVQHTSRVWEPWRTCRPCRPPAAVHVCQHDRSAFCLLHHVCRRGTRWNTEVEGAHW